MILSRIENPRRVQRALLQKIRRVGYCCVFRIAHQCQISNGIIIRMSQSWDVLDGMQIWEFKIGNTIVYRWVQDDASKMEERLRWHYKPTMGYSWRVDETYVKVKGKWAYLYRTIDNRGHTLDFYLPPTCNIQTAKRFLSKTLKSMKLRAYLSTVNTGKAPTYSAVITELKAEGKCLPDIVHRPVKYLNDRNNIIQADYGKLKPLINPGLVSKTMKTAYATIKGFEFMRMFKKGQMDAWKYGQGLTEGIRLIERQFDIYAT